MKGDLSFSVFYRIAVLNPAGSSSTGGDGMVFVLQPLTNFALGINGGGLGFQGISPSVGVAIDHLSTQTAEVFFDGDTGASLANATYGSSWVGGTHSIWIDYDGANHLLEMRAVANSDVRPATPLLSTTIDLATHFGDAPLHAGFTGSTGGAFAEHWVDAWYMAFEYAPIDLSTNTYQLTPTDLTLDASAPRSDRVSTLTLTVLDADGNPHANWPVTLTTDLGTLSATDATTDSQGKVTLTLSAGGGSDGIAHVQALAEGGAKGSVDVGLFAHLSILATSGANGTVTPSGDIPVPYGTDSGFEIQPERGFRIADVKIDGVSVGRVGSYTFTRTMAPHRLEASFKREGLRVGASCESSGGAKGTLWTSLLVLGLLGISSRRRARLAMNSHRALNE